MAAPVSAKVTVILRFDLPLSHAEGESWVVSGSIVELGNLEPAKAMPMSAIKSSGFCRWQLRLQVSAGQAFVYKYVCLRPLHEPLEGKTLSAVASGPVVIVDDTAPEVKQQILALLRPDKASVIKLNVGGTMFTTSGAVLRLVPTSRLAQLFAPDVKLDVDTPIFLDRDPEIFAHLLRWLRTGFVPPLDEVGGFEHLLLRAEAEFWGLSPLVCALSGVGSTEIIPAVPVSPEILKAEEALLQLKIAEDVVARIVARPDFHPVFLHHIIKGFRLENAPLARWNALVPALSAEVSLPSHPNFDGQRMYWEVAAWKGLSSSTIRYYPAIVRVLEQMTEQCRTYCWEVYKSGHSAEVIMAARCAAVQEIKAVLPYISSVCLVDYPPNELYCVGCGFHFNESLELNKCHVLPYGHRPCSLQA